MGSGACLCQDEAAAVDVHKPCARRVAAESVAALAWEGVDVIAQPSAQEGETLDVEVVLHLFALTPAQGFLRLERFVACWKPGLGKARGAVVVAQANQGRGVRAGVGE